MIYQLHLLLNKTSTNSSSVQRFISILFTVCSMPVEDESTFARECCRVLWKIEMKEANRSTATLPEDLFMLTLMLYGHPGR